MVEKEWKLAKSSADYGGRGQSPRKNDQVPLVVLTFLGFRWCRLTGVNRDGRACNGFCGLNSRVGITEGTESVQIVEPLSMRRTITFLSSPHNSVYAGR